MRPLQLVKCRAAVSIIRKFITQIPFTAYRVMMNIVDFLIEEINAVNSRRIKRNLEHRMFLSLWPFLFPSRPYAIYTVMQHFFALQAFQ